MCDAYLVLAADAAPGIVVRSLQGWEEPRATLLSLEVLTAGVLELCREGMSLPVTFTPLMGISQLSLTVCKEKQSDPCPVNGAH